MTAYRARRPSRSRFVAARGLRHHLREWGPADAPLLVMLHGARDTSASFQFIVDALAEDWHVVAPDWRGHGLTDWTPGDYWHAVFLCDLDAVLDAVEPHRSVRLAGHSMGGNLAGLYAGARPGRIQTLVMLDALGELLSRNPVQIEPILDLALRARTEARREPRAYDRPSDLAWRLAQRNHRLGPDRAAFLAETTARPLAGGGVGWPYDPTFRRSLPNMHRIEDWTALWRRVSAPTLCLLSTDPRPDAPTSHPDVVRERIGIFPDARVAPVPDTGHNLHHDAPDAVARAIETFLAQTSVRGRPVPDSVHAPR